MTIEPALVWPSKLPGETLDYAVNFEEGCARVWGPYQDWALNTRIRVYRPNHSSGYEFEATTAGRSGGRFPSFPTVIGATLMEGSVTWTAREISDDSLLRTISGTPVWSADSGVTISNESITEQKTIATISGGTDGQDYSVTVTATCSDGLVLQAYVVLPVRTPSR